MSFDVTCLGPIIARRVSEGPTCVASATSATNPSLTRRVMKNTANHASLASETLKIPQACPSVSTQLPARSGTCQRSRIAPVVERVNVPAVARNRMNRWTSPLVSTQVLSNCRAVGDARFHCARLGGATSEWLSLSRTALRAVIPRLGESSDCLPTLSAGPRAQWKREKRAKASL